jgi:guanylate kinase
MSAGIAGRLIILSGPSCVGKSPLTRALARFYPAIWDRLRKLVLFNSRSPRPGERDGEDYHFRILADVNRLSIFLSPLSKDEIVYLTAPERHVRLPELVTDVMRRKLLRRTRRQKGELSLKDLENIETRASSAYRELLGTITCCRPKSENRAHRTATLDTRV